jgi:hypothetical protein
MSAHADELIDGLAKSMLESVQQNPEAWSKIGEFMIAAMFGPLGIATAVMIEYLRAKSAGLVQGPIRGGGGGGIGSPSAGMPGALPKHAEGTNSARSGLAVLAEKGMELVRTAQNKLFLVTQPMVANMQGGERVYNRLANPGYTPPAARQRPANPPDVPEQPVFELG